MSFLSRKALSAAAIKGVNQIFKPLECFCCEKIFMANANQVAAFNKGQRVFCKKQCATKVNNARRGELYRKQAERLNEKIDFHCKKCGKTYPEVTFNRNKSVWNKKCNDCLHNARLEIHGDDPITVTCHENELLTGKKIYTLMMDKCRQLTGLRHVSKKQCSEVIQNETGLEIGYCVVQRMQRSDSLSVKSAEVMAKFLNLPIGQIKTVKDLGMPVVKTAPRTIEQIQADKRKPFFDGDSRRATSILFFIQHRPIDLSFSADIII